MSNKQKFGRRERERERESANWQWIVVVVLFMRDATSTTFLQQFYNKSQVASCYWFKFETNTKNTFLP